MADTYHDGHLVFERIINVTRMNIDTIIMQKDCLEHEKKLTDIYIDVCNKKIEIGSRIRDLYIELADSLNKELNVEINKLTVEINKLDNPSLEVTWRKSEVERIKKNIADNIKLIEDNSDVMNRNVEVTVYKVN